MFWTTFRAEPLVWLLHSPLLKPSQLLSLPPLSDMLKFSGSLPVSIRSAALGPRELVLGLGEPQQQASQRITREPPKSHPTLWDGPEASCGFPLCHLACLAFFWLGSAHTRQQWLCHCCCTPTEREALLLCGGLAGSEPPSSNPLGCSLTSWLH